MRWNSVILACAFLSLELMPTLADDRPYSAQEIVKFFTEQGKNRGLCIGTDEECSPSDKKPAGFNLRLTFMINSAKLTDEAKTNLNIFAEALKNPSLSVANFSVEGYTDATGSDDYNLTLSQRRAESVVAYLGELGVDTSKLNPKGFGKSNPLENDPYNPENRRVETRLLTQLNDAQ